MEVIIYLLLIVVIVKVFAIIFEKDTRRKRSSTTPRSATSSLTVKRPSSISSRFTGQVQYYYRKKPSLITASEREFFQTLTAVAGDRYHIFPQIHLSSLMTNETRGKYHKLSFQRINRRSVDYVLCDKHTFQPVYAVELDDATHNRPGRQARDEMIEQIFADIGMPLVRFKNYRSLSHEDVAQKFHQANTRYLS